MLLPVLLNAAPTHKKSHIPIKKSTPAPTSTFTLLAQHLTAHCKTDSQKAFAIFRWISDNISYDVCAFHNVDTPNNIIPEWPPEWGYGAHDTWYNNQVAKLVLERRLGVCEGYARLFKAMCDVARVEAVVIDGYARREERIGREFAVNHAWNAVRLNGQWRLLDATWASGSCDSGTLNFTRGYDSDYWMTPPDVLLQDHYPLNPDWALLKTLPPLWSFFREPLHHPSYLTARISNYTPANGWLDASPGETFTFSLTGIDTVLIPVITFVDWKWDWHMADGQPGEAKELEALKYLYANSSSGIDVTDTLPKPLPIDPLAERLGLLDRLIPECMYAIKGNTYSYKFKIPQEGARFIFISCNGRLLLTYAVKRPKASLPLPPHTAPHQ